MTNATSNRNDAQEIPRLTSIDVPPAAIDLFSADATRFCVSFEPSVEAVASSIRRVGLLQPPVITRDSSGSYKVVCGLARALALVHLGWKTIPARAMQGGLAVENYILTSIEDNLSRGLSPVEINIAIEKLCGAGWTSERIVNELFPRMNLPCSRRHFRRFAALRVLPESVLRRIHNGEIDPSVGELIVDFTEEDRHALIDVLFERTRLSLGEIRSVIDLLRNIAGQSGMTIKQVLDDPDFQAILSQDTHPRQKGQELRRAAKRKAFPRFTETAQAFENTVQEARLGPAASVVPPENFEKNDVRIVICSSRAEEIRAAAQHLLDACESGMIEKLLNIVRARE